jgi:hypothetical protein
MGMRSHLTHVHEEGMLLWAPHNEILQQLNA